MSVDSILHGVRSSLEANVYSTLKTIPAEKGKITLEDILFESEKSDKLSNMIINTISEGFGIANLVNVFDPGVIILGGEVIDIFGDHVLENVGRIVRLKAINAISSRTEILRSGVRDFSASRGAATLLIEKQLHNEILNI